MAIAWRSVGSVQAGKTRLTLPWTFNRRLVRVVATAIVPAGKNWNKAGDLVQLVGVDELAVRYVPLNQGKVLVFPMLSPYKLVFEPVPWISVRLSVSVFLYDDASIVHELSLL